VGTLCLAEPEDGKARIQRAGNVFVECIANKPRLSGRHCQPLERDVKDFRRRLPHSEIGTRQDEPKEMSESVATELASRTRPEKAALLMVAIGTPSRANRCRTSMTPGDGESVTTSLQMQSSISSTGALLKERRRRRSHEASRNSVCVS
jgi:hypothetical protein